ARAERTAKERDRPLGPRAQRRGRHLPLAGHVGRPEPARAGPAVQSVGPDPAVLARRGDELAVAVRIREVAEGDQAREERLLRRTTRRRRPRGHRDILTDRWLHARREKKEEVGEVLRL